MRRRNFLLWAFSIAVGIQGRARAEVAEWTLISQDQVDREKSEAAKHSGSNEIQSDASSTIAGGPKIEIKSPDLSHPIKAPVTIAIVFSAEPGAKIVPPTFRASYGSFLKVDITDKIKANAKLDQTGLFADGVKLPSGKHTVFISIGDDHGRVSTREIDFTIV